MRRVQIIGGGIAGLSAGIALRRLGVPVEVLEAQSYPRHRVCGEFLSGLREGDLQRLGIARELRHCPRLDRTAWFSGGRLLLKARLPEPALAVSRRELDHRLAEAFSALGGHLRCGERADLREKEGRVMAAGRRRSGAGWIGLKAHYEGLELAADLEMHLGRGGYAGVTRLADGRANVCALLPQRGGLGGPRGQALPRHLRACGMSALATRLESARAVEDSLSGVSHFQLGAAPASAEGVSVGDHAAVIAPFTGHGMALAVQSAWEAVPHLARWAAGGSCWRETAAEVRHGQRRRFGSRLRWSRWLQPWLLSPAGHRLLGAAGTCGILPFRWLLQRVR